MPREAQQQGGSLNRRKCYKCFEGYHYGHICKHMEACRYCSKAHFTACCSHSAHLNFLAAFKARLEQKTRPFSNSLAPAVLPLLLRPDKPASYNRQDQEYHKCAYQYCCISEASKSGPTITGSILSAEGALKFPMNMTSKATSVLKYWTTIAGDVVTGSTWRPLAETRWSTQNGCKKRNNDIYKETRRRKRSGNQFWRHTEVTDFGDRSCCEDQDPTLRFAHQAFRRRASQPSREDSSN